MTECATSIPGPDDCPPTASPASPPPPAPPLPIPTATDDKEMMMRRRNVEEETAMSVDRHKAADLALNPSQA